MLSQNRVIFKDNTVLTDWSVALSNYISDTKAMALVATEDALFVGSDMPFNHRWVELSVVNDQASALSGYVWNGDAWVAVVDLIDETAVGGASLGKSGLISFTPDRLKSWFMERNTADMTSSGLETQTIYDMFWAKFVWSGNLKATTAFQYIGHKFANDEDLFPEYPGLASTAMMSAYKSGKTNWNEQHFLAAEYIIQDLRGMNIAFSGSQILSSHQFKIAGIHKCAEIAYRGMGEDYTEERNMSDRAYKDAMKIGPYLIDKNANADVDNGEERSSVEYLKR